MSINSAKDTIKTSGPRSEPCVTEHAAGKLRMRDMKMWHKEKCRAGKYRAGKYGTRNPGLENARKISMESEQMLYKA